MKATTKYLQYLLQQRAASRAQQSTLQRMHDLGIEPRREVQDQPAWAEAFGEKLQRYFYGGIERENMPSVG